MPPTDSRVCVRDIHHFFQAPIYIYMFERMFMFFDIVELQGVQKYTELSSRRPATPPEEETTDV